MVKNKKKDLNTEQKILGAARKVFTTMGMAGARMQDIADEAGINKAMLHYYFRDKDKLFEVVFMEEAEKFFPKITRIFESDSPLEKKIKDFVSEYVDEITANPYLPWFVLNELNRDPEKFLQKIWSGHRFPRPAKFLEQINNEIRQGNIRPVNPLHLLMNLLSMTIFPFVAKPILTRNLGISESQFKRIMEERKKEVPAFIMAALKK